MSPLEIAILHREAAAVKRWHTQRTIREQTLATHSYGLVMLVVQLDPMCRKELMLAALKHDLPEFITGDMPAHTKRNNPALAIMMEEMEKGCAPLYEDFNLTVGEERLLKFCDLMELVLFCHEEFCLGNRYAAGPLEKGITWLWDMLPSMRGTLAYHPARAMLAQATSNARDMGIKVEEHMNERE